MVAHTTIYYLHNGSYFFSVVRLSVRLRAGLHENDYYDFHETQGEGWQ